MLSWLGVYHIGDVIENIAQRLYDNRIPLLEATERSLLTTKQRWTKYPTPKGSVDLLGMYCRPHGVGTALHTDGHARACRPRLMFQI